MPQFSSGMSMDVSFAKIDLGDSKKPQAFSSLTIWL